MDVNIKVLKVMMSPEIVDLPQEKAKSLFKVVRLALLEQDRDTRHACAEAVMTCNLDISGKLVYQNSAHDRCMNVKAI